MNEKYTSPLITAVIPTRNNDTDLIDCINSLMNLDYDLKNIYRSKKQKGGRYQPYREYCEPGRIHIKG
jgi:GT2 family glycosyltransferase